MLTLLN